MEPEKIVRNYQSGAIIFNEGDDGHEMFVVASGEVEIFLNQESQEHLIGVLRPGDMFGEMALVGSGLRTASARAACDDTALVCINEARFVYLVSQQPAFALSVIRTMAQRLSVHNHNH